MAKSHILLFLVSALFILGVAYFIPKTDSVVIIGAVFGLLVGLLTFVRVEFGIFILVLSMLLSPELKVAQVPGREVAIRVDDVLLMIVFLSWSAKMAIEKRVILFKKNPVNAPFLVYVILSIIVTLKGVLVGNVNPIKSFFYVLKTVEYYLLFLMVSNIAETEAGVKRYLTVGLVTLAIVVGYSYYLIATGQTVNAPFQSIIGAATQKLEPGSIGGYFVICMAVLLGLVLNMKEGGTVVAALLGLLILVPPLLNTFSRASYMAFAVMLVSAFLLTKKKRWFFGAALICAALLIPAIMPGNVNSRILVTFQGQQIHTAAGIVNLDESSTARIIGYAGIITDVLPKHLLFGYGVTGVGFIDGQYFSVLGELGVVGFVVFIWLLVSLFRLGYTTYRDGKTHFSKAVAFGLTISLIAVMTHAATANTFLVVRIIEPFWFLAALVCVLRREADASGKKGAAETAPIPEGQVL